MEIASELPTVTYPKEEGDMGRFAVPDVARITREIIFEVLEREYTGNSQEALIDEANLSFDLGLDSLHIIDILSGMEEAFEIAIPDDEAQGLTTVGKLISYVEVRLAEVDNPAAIGAA